MESVSITKLKKIISTWQSATTEPNISFEYLIGSCFPHCWENIQEEMKNQYRCGYIDGVMSQKIGE